MNQVMRSYRNNSCKVRDFTNSRGKRILNTVTVIVTGKIFVSALDELGTYVTGLRREREHLRQDEFVCMSSKLDDLIDMGKYREGQSGIVDLLYSPVLLSVTRQPAVDSIGSVVPSPHLIGASAAEAATEFGFSLASGVGCGRSSSSSIHKRFSRSYLLANHNWNLATEHDLHAVADMRGVTCRIIQCLDPDGLRQSPVKKLGTGAAKIHSKVSEWKSESWGDVPIGGAFIDIGDGGAAPASLANHRQTQVVDGVEHSVCRNISQLRGNLYVLSPRSESSLSKIPRSIWQRSQKYFRWISDEVAVRGARNHLGTRFLQHSGALQYECNP